MNKSIYIVLAVFLCPAFASAKSLESLKHGSATLTPVGTGKISFSKVASLKEVGRRLNREELERLTDRELLLREIQLVREADAASLGEAYAFEEALVRIEAYTRESIPESDEAAIASGVLRALTPFSRDVRSSGLTPRKMARPDFLFTGPTQQARFFALIDAVFSMRFDRFRAMLGLPITDVQLSKFGLTPETRGLGKVIDALGSRTRDAWILVFYADKRLERIRYTKRYDEIESERKLIRDISSNR